MEKQTTPRKDPRGVRSERDFKKPLKPDSVVVVGGLSRGKVFPHALRSYKGGYSSLCTAVRFWVMLDPPE